MENNRITRSERNEKIISDFLILTEESLPEMTMILYPSEAKKYQKIFPIEITEASNPATRKPDMRKYIIRRKL